MPHSLGSEQHAAGETLPIPRFFLGTERFGSVVPLGLGPANDHDTFVLLDRVVAAGCRGLDMAASYQLGGTERLIGDWLVSRRNRHDLFLLTKGGHPYPVVKPNRLGVADIASDLNDSLRRLRTDYVDLYLLHRDHPSADLEKLVRALADHVNQGKIRAWGVSNWHHDRILALQRVAKGLGVPGPVASSPQFSLAEWSTPPWKGSISISGAGNKQAREFYARAGLPVLAYSALGRGFFSSGSSQATYRNAPNAAKHARAVELAARLGKTPAQIALAYLFHQPFAVHPVVSVGSVEHFRDNLEALEVHLSPAECHWLEMG